MCDTGAASQSRLPDRSFPIAASQSQFSSSEPNPTTTMADGDKDHQHPDGACSLAHSNVSLASEKQVASALYWAMSNAAPDKIWEHMLAEFPGVTDTMRQLYGDGPLSRLVDGRIQFSQEHTDVQLVACADIPPCCFACRKETVEKVMTCSRCGYSMFHPGCQRASWSRHKAMCNTLAKQPADRDKLKHLIATGGIFTDGDNLYSLHRTVEPKMYKLIELWHRACKLSLAKGISPPVCPLTARALYSAYLSRERPPTTELDQLLSAAHSITTAYYQLTPNNARLLAAWIKARGYTKVIVPAAGNGLFVFMLSFFGDLPVEMFDCTDIKLSAYSYVKVRLMDACDPKGMRGADKTTLVVLLWPEYPWDPSFAAKFITMCHERALDILGGFEESGCAMSEGGHKVLAQLYGEGAMIPGIEDFPISHCDLGMMWAIMPQGRHVVPYKYLTDIKFRMVDQRLRIYLPN